MRDAKVPAVELADIHQAFPGCDLDAAAMFGENAELTQILDDTVHMDG